MLLRVKVVTSGFKRFYVTISCHDITQKSQPTYSTGYLDLDDVFNSVLTWKLIYCALTYILKALLLIKS